MGHGDAGLKSTPPPRFSCAAIRGGGVSDACNHQGEEVTMAYLFKSDRSGNRRIAVKQLSVDLDKSVHACARALSHNDVHIARNLAYIFRKLTEHCELSARAYTRDHNAKLLRHWAERK